MPGHRHYAAGTRTATSLPSRHVRGSAHGSAMPVCPRDSCDVVICARGCSRNFCRLVRFATRSAHGPVLLIWHARRVAGSRILAYCWGAVRSEREDAVMRERQVRRGLFLLFVVQELVILLRSSP